MRSLNRDKDTICALATAAGAGAISIVRVSGAASVAIVRRLAPFIPESPESHRVYYGFLRSPGTGEVLDEVLVTYFRAGRSFTGEETCEISCHGSASVVDEVLTELVSLGARPADRGEFTYRAFMSGRIDLIQAESVLGLIESRSPRASRLALRQLRGEFSDRLNAVREDLTWVLAQLEANIDYASEDIVIAETGILTARLEAVRDDVEALMGGYRRGRLLRDGFQIALVGAPNVGKSSLLNALCGEERAIVSPVAGTTRDFVEGKWLSEGVRVRLIDTAGLRETTDLVESIGVARTVERMRDVDLIFFVQDGDALPDARFTVPWEKTVLIRNKSDLYSARLEAPAGVLATFDVSATTKAGLGELNSWLRTHLTTEVGEDSVLVSSARHFRGLETVRAAVAATLPLLEADESPDLVALELQTALRAVYDILGLTFDDQIMDRVFADFCLGK